MEGQTPQKAYVNQQVLELGIPMFFTGPAGRAPLDLKTLNSEAPAHPLLQAYGELFLMAATPRDIMLPGSEVVSSLAGYKRHARRYKDVRLAGGTGINMRDEAQKMWVDFLLVKMSALRNLVRHIVGEKEVQQYEELGRGLAQVFGTYFAGIEAYEGEVSPQGKRLVLMLAITPPIPIWKRVFTRAMEGKTYGQSHSAYCIDLGSRVRVSAYSKSATSGLSNSDISTKSESATRSNVTDFVDGNASGSLAPTGSIMQKANDPESVLPDAIDSVDEFSIT